MKRATLLILPLLILNACATKRTADSITPIPVGTYTFSGSVEKTDFAGTFVLDAEGLVSLECSLGTCSRGVESSGSGVLRADRRELDVTCGGLTMRLRWDANGALLPDARADVRLTHETQERRCIQREKDGVCVEYGVDTRTHSSTYRTVVTVQPEL